MQFSGQAIALDLAPHDAAIELMMGETLLARLKDRLDGLREQLTAELKLGSRVPFYELAKQPGRERWLAGAEEVANLGRVFGVDLVKPLDVITPAQARKIFPVVSMLEPLTVRTASTVLQKTDDSETRRVFGA